MCLIVIESWKNIIDVSKVLIKVIAFITKEKLHLHVKEKKTLDKDLSFTKLFKLHLSYVNFITSYFLFCSFQFFSVFFVF